LYFIKIWTDFSSVLSQSTGSTDRQTDSFLITRPRLHSMQRGKNTDPAGRTDTLLLTRLPCIQCSVVKSQFRPADNCGGHPSELQSCTNQFLSVRQVRPESVCYELDEYYFMSDPHQLIFSHFPDSSDWQLLEQPISLSTFEDLVPVKSSFFKYGLQVHDYREAIIPTHGELTVRISVPSVKVHSHFHAGANLHCVSEKTSPFLFLR